MKAWTPKASHNYITAIVSEASDLSEALLWDEEAEDEVIDIMNVVETHSPPTNSIKPIIPALTNSFSTHSVRP